MIATLLPRNACTVHSINSVVNHYYYYEEGEIGEEIIHQYRLPYEELLYLLSLFNALTMNYYLRNKVSANLTMFYIYELPVPEVTAELKETIAQKAFDLLQYKAGNGEFDGLADELNLSDNGTDDPVKTRAELEVIIAKQVFGLNKKDWDYLTATFVYGGDSETKQELDRIIEASKALM